MSRVYGTVSMGLRAPIIRQGDDLVDIVSGCVAEAMNVEGLIPRDRDVVCMTEAIVARAQGNYASVDQIADSYLKRWVRTTSHERVSMRYC